MSKEVLAYMAIASIVLHTNAAPAAAATITSATADATAAGTDAAAATTTTAPTTTAPGLRSLCTAKKLYP